MSLSTDFNKILSQAEEAFKEVAVGVQNEIVDQSPVDTGRFKTAWQVEELDIKKFSFSMVNNVEYANKLWFGKHSKKGWGAKGGISVIKRWESTLQDRFDAIHL